MLIWAEVSMGSVGLRPILSSVAEVDRLLRRYCVKSNIGEPTCFEKPLKQMPAGFKWKRRNLPPETSGIQRRSDRNKEISTKPDLRLPLTKQGLLL